MILFADSAGWMAAYDAHDKYHAMAKAALQNLSDQKVTFIVTDYVVAESITLMRGRLGHVRAVAFGDWLLQAPHVRLMRIDADLWNEAWGLFKMFDDKEFSFTDCASFTVMRRQRLRDAFTFDRHFEQAGFRLWPR